MALWRASSYKRPVPEVILRTNDQTEVGVLCPLWLCSWSSRYLPVYQEESKHTPNAKQLPTWQRWWEMNQGLPGTGAREVIRLRSMVSENMLLEEAFYMERQRKQQPKQPQKDPSDKNFYHKDQFQFFVKQIGTHTANKKFPENLQFKKYLVVHILTYLIMKTLL